MKFVFSYRGAGARVILAETCQLVHFPTPFFLAAQRRTASAVKKKLPKENPSKGFSLDSFGNRGAAAPLAPQAARYGRLYQLSVLTYF